MTITDRQALDVKGEIARNKSWVLFREFIEERAREHNVNAEVMSEDFTKLLKREQMLGAEAELRRLMETFLVHVDNNTIIENPNSNQS